MKEAIAAHQDIEVIRSLFEGGKVPDEARADLWKVNWIAAIHVIPVCDFRVSLMERKRVDAGRVLYPSTLSVYSVTVSL